MIPCSLPKDQFETCRKDVEQAVQRVLDSGWYILGKEVSAFEAEFATYLGTAHGIGVNSGTDAITIGLRALGILPGDEVVTVSHTAIATIAAIEAAGAKPVLVDIDAYYTMDPDALEAAITPKTKAVVVVHLYGQVADMDRILPIAKANGLKVVEDCAQATGADWKGRKAGSMGDVGCFSFYPTKNLGAIGDGGMLVTANADVAARARMLREYGWNETRSSQIPGCNSRLDELQAAILRAKLPHLDAGNRSRQAIAARYGQALADIGVALPAVRDGASHVYHLYVLRYPQRDAMLERMQAKDVACGVHYRKAAHQQPAYAGRLAGAETLHRTDAIVDEILSLPMYPELDDASVDAVIAALRSSHEDLSR